MMSGEQAVWTIGRLLDWTREHLQRCAVDQPRLTTELLLAHALNCSRVELYTRYHEVPTVEQRASFKASIQAAARHTPVAYVVGQKEFYSLLLRVTPAVLIPRPETEVLVERVIRHCEAFEGHRVRILDLGTGCGNIGLALCKYVPGAEVFGSDICTDALAVAADNAVRLGLADRFATRHADGLNMDLPDIDVLVSNPPYVGTDRADVELAENVRRHEPHLALFAGPDGLAFYRRIAQESPAVLAPRSSIFVEIGYGQQEAVRDIMTAQNTFEFVESWRDYNEGHIRVMHFHRAQ